MMLSLAGLRAIEALATHGSITSASSALGYTSSAVSQQIKRLERDVRQPLIERQGRRATLGARGAPADPARAYWTACVSSVGVFLRPQLSTRSGGYGLLMRRPAYPAHGSAALSACRNATSGL